MARAIFSISGGNRSRFSSLYSRTILLFHQPYRDELGLSRRFVAIVGRLARNVNVSSRSARSIATRHRNDYAPLAITPGKSATPYPSRRKHPAARFCRPSTAWLFSLTLSSFIYILFKTPPESGTGVGFVPANRIDWFFRLKHCKHPVRRTSSKPICWLYSVSGPPGRWLLFLLLSLLQAIWR